MRELGLPREALLNVIVRRRPGHPAARLDALQAGDRLHVLVRQEVAREFVRAARALARRADRRPARSRTTPRSSKAISVVRPWTDGDGDPGRPRSVLGVAAVEHMRSRRDRPGALVALEDGRYAFTGPIMAVGPRAAVQAAARKRMRAAQTDAERAWWEEVIGAMAR